MKKTLIALAVVGAFGAAQAQSNVTVYGQFQPSFDSVKVKDSNAAGDVNYGQMKDNAGRIGFKGTEDLGGGLKAIFQAESYYDLVAKGGFNAGSRDAFVGLEGGFGKFQMGAYDPVYKRITASYDPFGDSLSDYNSIMGVGVWSMKDAANSVDLNKRYSNVLGYTSPNMGGVVAMIDYAYDTKDDQQYVNATTTKKLSLGATYNIGPLNVLAAYASQKASQISGTEVQELKAMKIGVAYTLPTKTTIRGIYESIQQDKKIDKKDYFLGVEHPIGNVDLLANYIMATDNDEVTTKDTGASAINLGARYNFSKRTNILAMYTRLKNDDNAAYASDAGYAATITGATVSGYSVRLQHKF
jgi:predicted porin